MLLYGRDKVAARFQTLQISAAASKSGEERGEYEGQDLKG